MNELFYNKMTLLKKYISSYIYEMLLVIIWIIIALVINPQGNFPLNDDWVFGKAVETLLNEGIYNPGDLAAMSLIAQVCWGGLICFIFGFSYTILRISTIIIGIIGILFLYGLLKKVVSNGNVAFIGALIIIINPLYLSLSYTFMTDVPFAAMFILAIYFFFKALKGKNNLYLIIATIFSIIAIFIRQLGLLLPLSFAITYLFSYRISGKAAIKVIIPFIISVLLLLTFNYWLKNTGNMPEYYEKVGGVNSFINRLKMPVYDILHESIWRVGSVFKYCAIFLLPLILLIAPSVIIKLIRSKKLASIYISAFITSCFCIEYPTSRFFIGNILFNIGIGPKLLKDTYLIGLDVSPKINSSFINFISISGTFFFFILLVLLLFPVIELIKNIRKKDIRIKEKILIFSFMLLFFYTGFLFFSETFFDRYLIISVILILIILITSYGDLIKVKHNSIMTIFSLFFFLLISYFSIAGTHDYISWNRARWKAINYLLEERKISPHLIDGGYEFNGCYNIEQYRSGNEKTNWWFADKDDYIISFGNIIDYSSVKTFTYPYYLFGTDNKIEVLERDSIFPVKIPITIEFSKQCSDKPRNKYSKEYFVANKETGKGQRYLSGKFSTLLDKQHPFGLKIEMHDILPLDSVKVSVWRYAENNDAGLMANSITDNNFFISDFTPDKLKDRNGWKLLNMEFTIPSYVKGGVEIYICNRGEKTVYFDDLEINVSKY